MNKKKALAILLLLLCFICGFLTIELANYGAAERLAGRCDGKISFNLIRRLIEWGHYFPNFVVFLLLPYEYIFHRINNSIDKTRKKTFMNIGYILLILFMLFYDAIVLSIIFTGRYELHFLISPPSMFTYFVVLFLAINLFFSKIKTLTWWMYELIMIGTGCIFCFIFYTRFTIFSTTVMLIFFSIGATCVTWKLRNRNHVLHMVETACIVTVALLVIFIILGERMGSLSDWINLNQNQLSTNFDHNILHKFWYENRNIILNLENANYFLLCYPLVEIFFGGDVLCGIFFLATLLLFTAFVYVARKTLVKLKRKEKLIVFDSLVFLVVMLYLVSFLSQLTFIPTVVIVKLVLFGCKEADFFILALLIRLLVNPYKYIYNRFCCFVGRKKDLKK